MRRGGVFLGLVVAAAALGMATDADAQCAMCRTALESSEQGQAIAEKFNAGILFLLGAPFSVVGGIAVATRKSWRGHDTA